jgi:hypothetical protein
MRRTIAILIFIAILALGAHAQRANDLEPYSVKGDKLGETAAEWLASDPAHKNWACGEALHKGTYAEVLLASESVFFVARGHKLILYKVEMNLWNDMYLPRIMTALRDKFGTPAAHEVTSLQNTDGAALDRSMWRWTNGLSSVELVYALGAPNDVPALTFTLDSPSEEVEKREDKKKDDAARNDM